MSSPLSLAPARAAHVRAAGVHVSFGGRPVLAGVDLVAAAGDRVAVVGENGRGKTTLLRVLAGDLPADRGEVRRAGSVGVADQQLPLGGAPLARCDSPEGGRRDGRQPTKKSPCQRTEDAKPQAIPETGPSGDEPPEASPAGGKARRGQRTPQRTCEKQNPAAHVRGKHPRKLRSLPRGHLRTTVPPKVEPYRYFRNGSHSRASETFPKIVDSSSVRYSYFFSDTLLNEEEVRT